MCACVCMCVCVCVRVCAKNLNPEKSRNETLVEVIASERNVRPKLGAPQRHLLRKHGPQHGIKRAVAHLHINSKTDINVSDYIDSRTHMHPHPIPPVPMRMYAMPGKRANSY